MNRLAAFHRRHRHLHQQKHPMATTSTTALLFLILGVLFVHPHVTPIRASTFSTLFFKGDKYSPPLPSTQSTSVSQTTSTAAAVTTVDTSTVDTKTVVTATRHMNIAVDTVDVTAWDDLVALLNNYPDTTDTDHKVQVELYYESQCPGCRQLITTSFAAAYHTEGFLDMADITFIPYGNALETQNDDDDDTYSFECQHGASECVYNLIETCAIHKLLEWTQFQFIKCIEQHDENRATDQDYESVALACGKSLGIEMSLMDEIKACVFSHEGNSYEHAMAVKTEALEPPHTYVPYVVVDGSHTETIQTAVTTSLFEYVCRTYQGTQKSTQCPPTTKSISATATASVPTTTTTN